MQGLIIEERAGRDLSSFTRRESFAFEFSSSGQCRITEAGFGRCAFGCDRLDPSDEAGHIGRSARACRKDSSNLDQPGVVCIVECRGGSEEHTSELQSLMRISYAVFCLKKTKHTNTKKTQQHEE